MWENLTTGKVSKARTRMPQGLSQSMVQRNNLIYIMESSSVHNTAANWKWEIKDDNNFEFWIFRSNFPCKINLKPDYTMFDTVLNSHFFTSTPQLHLQLLFQCFSIERQSIDSSHGSYAIMRILWPARGRRLQGLGKGYGLTFGGDAKVPRERGGNLLQRHYKDAMWTHGLWWVVVACPHAASTCKKAAVYESTVNRVYQVHRIRLRHWNVVSSVYCRESTVKLIP